MNVVANRQLVPFALPGIEHRTLAGAAQGLRHVEMWRQTLEPGAATPGTPMPLPSDCAVAA